MTTIRSLMTYGAVAAALTLGSVAVFSAPASAHVVCNSAGDCWSTHSRHKYPRDLHVQFYSDRYSDEAYRNKHWRNRHNNWRNDHHERDRGYYRNGIWITF